MLLLLIFQKYLILQENIKMCFSRLRENCFHLPSYKDYICTYHLLGWANTDIYRGEKSSTQTSRAISIKLTLFGQS